MRLQRVTMRYRRGGPAVLDNVSLDLPERSLTYIRGGNGSGKSTLLRIIAGVTRPSAGAVEGRPRTVGYVPERFPASLRFTPVEYLTHLGSIRGLHRPGAEVAELLDRFGLEAFAGTRMDRLSKGTTQKVAAAQAFLAHPPVLVLDESWTGLDVAAHQALATLVLERQEAGALVLFTDHRGRAQQLAPDATYLVAAGEVVAQAAAEATPTGRQTTPTGTQMTHRGGQVASHAGGLPATTRVELAGAVEEFDAASLPGVISVDSLPGALAVEVDAGDCDQLLLAALTHGLSVRRVAP